MNKERGINNLTILFIPIGIAANFVCGQIAIQSRLPIYLDTIGTILVGALCGAIPGVVVGLASNISNSLTSPPMFFFAILNALFGVAAAHFSKRRAFLSLEKTLLSAVFFALIGGGVGCIIAWLVYDFDFTANSSNLLSYFIHQSYDMPKFAAQLITDIGRDFVDKLITLLVVYCTLGVLPDGLLKKLPLGEIYIDDEHK